LGLQIGGEAGVFLGGDVHAAQFRTAAHPQRSRHRFTYFHARAAQLGDKRAQMIRLATGDVEIAAGDGPGDQKGSGLDTVGDNRVLRAAQFRDSFDADHAGSRTVYVRSHFREQSRQVHHLRLARRVMDDGLAACQHRGHHQVLGAGDRDAVEMHFGAFQAMRRFGFNVAVLLANGGA